MDQKRHHRQRESRQNPLGAVHGGEPVSRTDAQFKLRMPAALRAQVEQAAKQARRSLNAEIILRLEASFAQVKQGVSQ